MDNLIPTSPVMFGASNGWTRRRGKRAKRAVNRAEAVTRTYSRRAEARRKRAVDRRKHGAPPPYRGGAPARLGLAK